jgi:hypothetical protein
VGNACPVRAHAFAAASKSMPDPEGRAGQQPATPPESIDSQRSWPGLDRLGLIQAIGGLFLGLIALFSSYDHISVAGTNLQLQQQWGILFIAASVATIFVDAELATRTRYRAADKADRAAYEADRDRDRAARSRKRQVERLERLHTAAVLSARVQLDPSATNRARLRAFLALISGEIPPETGENGA